MILIIGAGLAGLAAAQTLERAGRGDYLLLEAADQPGGRLRTTVTPRGYRLDHGFQVLLDSYAAIGRFVDWPRLQTGKFESGAVLLDGRDRWEIDHPLNPGAKRVRTAFSSALTPLDKVKLAGLVVALMRTSDARLLQTTAAARDVSTRQYLRELGYSQRAIRRFFQPFFGGVFLEEALDTSASLFRYYLKKFAYGEAHLPAEGIASMPQAMAAQLPADRLRLGARVERLVIAKGRVEAVELADGERLDVEALVLATDRAESAALLGEERVEPVGWRQVTSLWFRSHEPLTDSRKLQLVAGHHRTVRHYAQVTNVQPALAPDGMHLLHATVLHGADRPDAALVKAALEEISEHHPLAPTLLELVRVIRVPRAVPVQEPGFARTFPRLKAWLPRNVWLAGDQTAPASIETALCSGESAAEQVLGEPCG